MLEDAQRNCYVRQQRNNSQTTYNAQACGAQVASEVSIQPQYQQIKLALEVHTASIVVVRLMDGAKPQPPQTFKPADCLRWIRAELAMQPLLIGFEMVLAG